MGAKISFNGTTIKYLYFNGNKVKKAYKDGTFIYNAAETIAVPTLSGSYTYNGGSQTPTFSGYDSSKMSIGGTYSASNAGTYTATFTPLDGYQWADETTDARSVSWSIAQKSISGASISLGSAPTYNGSSQSIGVNSVTIDSLSATYSVSGNTGTNAGSYTLTCTGTGNFTGTQTASWYISKASGYVSLSSTSGSVNKNSSITFAVNSYSGSLSVGSSNTGVATTSISGATVYVNGVASGNSATIYVYVAESNNYTATSASYSIYVNYIWYRYYINYNWYKYNCDATVSGYSQSSSDVTSSLPAATGVIGYRFLVRSNNAYYLANPVGSSNDAQGYSSYTFDSSNGKYSKSGSSIFPVYGNSIQSYPYMFNAYTNPDTEILYCATTSTQNYISSGNAAAVYTSLVTVYRYTSYVSSYSYSQGSYIGTVASTNSGAYSNGRNSDGYWYTYYGTSNSGSYIDTVASSSSSTYADNGITGSYWYVKQ